MTFSSRIPLRFFRRDLRQVSSRVVRAALLGAAMVSLNACGGGTPGDTAATSATASTAVTTSLSVTPTTLALVVGKSAAAQATVLPANSTIAWSSGDTSIATVSSAGAVSCVAAGAATISVSTTDGHTTTIAVTCAKPFSIYEFLKLKQYQDASGTHSITDAWFESERIAPLNLIYSSKLVTCPLSSCTDEYDVDSTKIAIAAEAADSTGKTPVSLDLEVWDTKRFYPSVATGNGQTIVENLSEALQLFKADNPGAVVGLYGEVPQNTFGWSSSTEATYSALNPQYASVAALVDYYSPSLYNYNYDGTATGDANWSSAASFAVSQSRAFDTLNGTSKKVLPYITPVWTDSAGTEHLLTYDQMTFRLDALRAAGADGCILWISSSQVDPSTGALLVIDTTSGWFKAVLDFAQTAS